MERHLRMDVGGLASKGKRTPQGFLEVPGRISRAGVLVYVRRDGREFRELRLPEEIFKADSLATLQHAPVTDRHPNGLVTPSNVRAHQVGIVTSPRQDGRFVSGDLIVQDARMISRVDSGEAREISAGYTLALEMRSGVWEGERYDAIQRNITYNHAGLGPAGWGRAGGECSVRLDGLPDALGDSYAVERFDGEWWHEDAISMVPAHGMSAAQRRESARIRAMRFGIEAETGVSDREILEGESINLDEFGDPVNLRFPLNRDSALPAMLSAFMGEAQRYLNDRERRIILTRIVRRMVAVSQRPALDLDSPTGLLLPLDLRTSLLSRGDGGVTRREKIMDMTKIRIDGLQFEAPPQTAAATEKAIADRDAKISDEARRADAAEAKRDALEAENREIKARLDAATSPEAMAAAVNARIGLVSAAARITGDEPSRFDGKTDREIKIAVITHADRDFDPKDRSDDYVQARFDHAVAAAPERKDRRAATVANLRGAQGRQHASVPARNDGSEARVDSADHARHVSRTEIEDAWRNPLRISRG